MIVTEGHVGVETAWQPSRPGGTGKRDPPPSDTLSNILATGGVAGRRDRLGDLFFLGGCELPRPEAFGVSRLDGGGASGWWARGAGDGQELEAWAAWQSGQGWKQACNVDNG
ncbi:hypothetical protein MGG_15630 [Pyricularia oryzae 70-15]|uniref:Uncharacterized protein n=1 Tax=Pyricularia oryzae (strain 70-15 / ATCC MYA-4617 / FGSC 8958) TaxID=242507 RepID=G4MWJ1_PYRO7|nr:uncharacterized protein MGG_15630 [Pyricularia oryzae 70-15]EHA54239.1 hypothetical protein MGG_15630 [Pyricularia oryzae 70-15]